MVGIGVANGLQAPLVVGGFLVPLEVVHCLDALVLGRELFLVWGALGLLWESLPVLGAAALW